MVLVMGDFYMPRRPKMGVGEGDQFTRRYGLGPRNKSGHRLHEV